MAGELYTVPLPYGMTNTPNVGGGGNLEQFNSIVSTAARNAAPPKIQPVDTTPTASVAYSPSLKAFYVNGRIFEQDNDTEAANSLSYLNAGQRTPLPQGGDWQPLDTNSYLQHVQSIVDPGIWKLAVKNVGIGWDNMQMLGGSLVQFMGAEETGQNIIKNQIQDLAKTEVYNRQFTDIGTKQYGVERGLFDWFVANLAQQGPNMVESAVTATLGALGGAATGGGANPFTAAGGAIMALTGKQAFKQSVLAAAKKYAAGEALDAAESKLLREAAGITAAAVIKNPETRALSTQVLSGAARNEAINLYERGIAKDILQASADKVSRAGLSQAKVGGAALATLGQNYATGVADIYNEMTDAGVQDRATALALAIPYAALESVPEFLLAGRLFGDIGRKSGVLKQTAEGDISRARRFMNATGRAVKGGVVGGLSEGTTEAGQEALLLAANPFVDWDSPQGMSRLINSFAAGFGVGGPIGAMANLKDNKQSANILNPQQGSEPNALTALGQPPLEGDVMPPAGPRGPGPMPGLPGGSGQALALPQPPGINMNEPYNVVVGEGNLPSGPGTQAVLPIFDQNNPISVDEMRARMSPQPQQNVAPQQNVVPQVDPRQGALQFSGPAPYTQEPFNNQMATQLQQMQTSQQRQREFDAAQQQRAAQEQSVRDQSWNPARIQAEIQALEAEYAAEQAANQPPQRELPMVTPEPRAPKQLSLFRGKVKLPKMSKAEQKAARRALKAQQQVPVSIPTPVDLRRSPQMVLFTQEGKPSVAALKSAGRTQPVSVPTVQAGATQISPTGNVVTPATVAAAVSKLKKGATNATTQGQVQQGGKQERQDAGGRLQKNGGNRNVAPQEQGSGTEASRGNRLKQSGKKQEVKTQHRATYEGKPATVTIIRDAADPKKVTAVKVQTDGARLAELNLGSQGIVSDEKLLQNLRDTDIIDTPTQTKAEGKAAPKAETLKKGKPAPKKVEAVAAAAPETKAAEEPKFRSRFEGKSAEEAWDIIRDGLFVPFDRLPLASQEQVSEALANNKFNASTFQEIYDNADIELSPYEALVGEISAAETAADNATFRAAVDTVVFHAFFDGDSNSRRDGLVEMANQWLANTGFTDKQRKAINDSVVMQANERQKLEAAYKSGPQKGEAKPWFSYMEQHDLIGQIRDLNARVTMLPAKYKTTAEKSVGEQLTGKKDGNETSATRGASQAWNKLEDVIDRLITGIEIVTSKQGLAKLQADIAEHYAAAKAAKKLNYITSRMMKLQDYFTADGKLKTFKNVDGHYIPTTKDLTEEQVKKMQQDQRAARQAVNEEMKKEAEEAALQRERESGQSTSTKDILDEWDSEKQNDGMYYRDDGSPITSSIPIGRVRMLMNGFVSRFKIKPKTYVFKNIEDMKRVNPELYKQAAAARANGDFGSVNAVGYSFKGNVIIFSDFVRSEKQLGFVLAHESLGHFGFKAIMSSGELNTMLNTIYNSDARVRSAVEQMMTMRGMSKMEAIEEYLADYAAELDTNLLARAWNFIKNALNKIGLKFQDDVARMLVGQARKYMRDGNGSYISAAKLAENLRAMEQAINDGRYAADDLSGHNLGSTYFHTSSMNKIAGEYGGIHGAAKFFRDEKVGQFMKSNYKGFMDFAARTAEKVQTLDNMASRSDGLTRVFNIFQAQNNRARAYLSHYNRITAFTHTMGVTEKEKETAGELLAYAALFRGPQATEQMLRDAGKFVTTDEYGNITLNEAAIIKAKTDGLVTAEEFRKGFEFTDSLGNKQKFQFNVDEKANYWKVYLEQREAVAEAAIDVMLANFEASQYEQQNALGRVSALKNRETGAVFAAEDIAAIKQIAKVFNDMASERMNLDGAKLRVNDDSYERADKWLIEVTRAIYEDLKLNDWLGDAAADERVNQYKANTAYGRSLQDAVDNAKDEKARAQAQAKLDQYNRDVARTAEIIGKLKSLNAKGMTKEQTFKVQRAVRDLFLFQTQTQNAEYYAKRTILGSYVPFTRRGRLQVNLTAYDAKTGEIVQLDAATAGVMPYFQVDEQQVADQIRSELGDLFGGKEYKVLNNEGNEVTVTFVPESSVANSSPDLSDIINFNDFVYVLNRLNINIEPKERQRIVEALTAQNETARKNLNRTGNPGWDKNVIRNVSEYLESAAHISAKKIYRNRLDDVIQNNNYWLGSDEKLKQLERAVKVAKTDQERSRAQREYEKYAYQYIHMKAEGHTIEVNGTKHSTLGRGRLYKEEAKKLIRWHNERINISNSTEDMLTQYGSPLKMWAVVMQLGGSVASAAINLVSLVTHSWTYLSHYNSDRGYGGGFGLAASSRALTRATADVKNPKLADAEYLSKMLMVDKNWADFGLTEDEAAFLLDQTEKGTLQAAAFNALLGSSRGKVSNNKAAAAIQAWMSMFSYTEQLNRRVTALAAYRLEKQRALAEGLSEQEAKYSAQKFGQLAVNTSQGEYAMYNRPEMARGNLMQYVFMYKQFAIISVQLMMNMPMAGKLQFLGLLLLMSGMKGLPFADDAMDLFDTFCQMFGVKRKAVEQSLYEFFDSVIPGSAPYFMRGFVDQWTGATVSTRLGMGDLIPMTGMFRAGADKAREFEQFLGPVFSGMAGIATTGTMIAKYGAEALGISSDKTTINDILRESPLAAARALGDAYSYMDTGVISTPSGKVVARDASTTTMIARVLGFYPAIATKENDVVRLAKYTNDYAKEIKASFVAAYVKADLSKDDAAKAQIRQDVREWNEAAKGTGLEMKMFEASANRAVVEARRPTVERFKRTVPTGMRPEVQQMMLLHGITNEDLYGQ